MNNFSEDDLALISECLNLVVRLTNNQLERCKAESEFKEMFKLPQDIIDNTIKYHSQKLQRLKSLQKRLVVPTTLYNSE